MFSTIGSFGPNATTPAIMQFLQQNAVKTMSILTHNASVTIAISAAYTAAGDKVGIKTVYANHTVPFTSFDATSMALAVKQANPDAVIYPTALAPAISITQALQQQSFVPKVNW